METANYKTLNQLYNIAIENGIINKEKSFAKFATELKQIFKKEFNKEPEDNKEMFISYVNNFIDNLIFVKNLDKNINADGDENNKNADGYENNENENSKNKNNQKIDKQKLLKTLNIISFLLSITTFTLYSIEKFKNK